VEIWRKQVAANPLLAENHLGLAGALQLNSDFVAPKVRTENWKLSIRRSKDWKQGRASLGAPITRQG